jgi:hypothetical protein
MTRIVCHFSCGAASAVATKLVLSRSDPGRVVIYNAFIEEEHEDNRRFLSDCERWFDHSITVLRNEKYGASVKEVWRRERFMKSAFGASCSRALKHDVLDAVCLPDDIHVFGFTAEETKRAERFLRTGAMCPLIDAGLTHADCLAMVERAGIVLPAMYRLGFNNANCIGCCKGGEGYWNKIRKDFPDAFAEAMAIQESIGPNSYFFHDRKTGARIGLKDLDPLAGRHNDPIPSCSFFCDMAEKEIGGED